MDDLSWKNVWVSGDEVDIFTPGEYIIKYNFTVRDYFIYEAREVERKVIVKRLSENNDILEIKEKIISFIDENLLEILVSTIFVLWSIIILISMIREKIRSKEE